MITQSNGFLSSILTSASLDPNHVSNGEASTHLAKFRALEQIFFEKVHPEVDVGLAMREVRIAGSRRPNLFTTHGCRHIADLISSLDSIAKAIANPPSVLEAYILLCAAHVHDAANVVRREGHPERCRELIAEYKALFADTLVSQQVYDVASAHGGTHEKYGKDTLRSLDLDNSQTPRLPMLAAMLRIGDELSENPARVPQLVARHHEHAAKSQLAFAYARSFQKFELRKDSLYLSFGIYPPDASLRVEVNGQSVGFFEFLEAKLDVIDREARYCSQYGRPDFHIGRVKVSIRLFERAAPSPVKATLEFSWPLHLGYPVDPEPICVRSPELVGLGIRSLAKYFDATEVRGGERGGIFGRLWKGVWANL